MSKEFIVRVYELKPVEVATFRMPAKTRAEAIIKARKAMKEKPEILIHEIKTDK